ncbi:putative HTH-type transcriptional regulator [Spiroplasma clarkii]|nr:SIS domain-containing protein [Spiroplasma clarkii]ARU91362.1 putative HTH-type transcriptional regulator [Spiroplasma clarkii]
MVNSISLYRQVIIFGEGFMGIVGSDFEKKFKKIQKNVICVKYFEELKYINRSRESLFILLSVSGQTETLKRVIDFATQNFKSKKIVAITATKTFSWKEQVDMHLYGNYISLMPAYEKEVPCTSRFVVQYILDLIFIEYFLETKT